MIKLEIRQDFINGNYETAILSKRVDLKGKVDVKLSISGKQPRNNQNFIFIENGVKIIQNSDKILLDLLETFLQNGSLSEVNYNKRNSHHYDKDGVYLRKIDGKELYIAVENIKPLFYPMASFIEPIRKRDYLNQLLQDASDSKLSIINFNKPSVKKSEYQTSHNTILYTPMMDYNRKTGRDELLPFDKLMIKEILKTVIEKQVSIPLITENPVDLEAVVGFEPRPITLRKINSYKEFKIYCSNNRHVLKIMKDAFDELINEHKEQTQNDVVNKQRQLIMKGFE